MLDPLTAQRHTAHTLAPVPLLYVGRDAPGSRFDDGRLSDIAPPCRR